MVGSILVLSHGKRRIRERNHRRVSHNTINKSPVKSSIKQFITSPIKPLIVKTGRTILRAFASAYTSASSTPNFDYIPRKIRNRNAVSSDITVVIPCHISHIKYIPELLRAYNDQTLLPAEIIIVISEIKDSVSVSEIKNVSVPYKLNIIRTSKKRFAGENRRIGAENANTDIIVFQDADDLPHIQRLEAIKYLFDKNPECVHICHSFTHNSYDLKNYNINSIPHRKTSYTGGSGIANGTPSIRKRILADNINWFEDRRTGEDTSFNKTISKKYQNTIIITVPLYLYRRYNSSSKVFRI